MQCVYFYLLDLVSVLWYWQIYAINRRKEHAKLFDEQQRIIQNEYDTLQDKIEAMHQIYTDNYNQATSLFKDLFQSSVDGRAKIQTSSTEVIKFHKSLLHFVVEGTGNLQN